VALAGDKGAAFWKSAGKMLRGWLLGATGKAVEAVQTITSANLEFRSTGATLHTPLSFSYLARAYAQLGKFDDAWRCIGEAMTVVEKTKESWCVAEVNRTAGEIAVTPLKPDAAKAEAYFNEALSVARQQQAKSWELRAG
jgi:predicted ATPase